MQTVKRLLFGGLLAACAATAPTSTSTQEPVSIATTVTDRHIAALDPVALAAAAAPLDKTIASYFETAKTRRAYIMTDKPLYQPGETIWFRADLRATKTLLGGPPVGVTMSLVSPRGAVAASKRVLAQGGIARNDFALPAELEGGEYTIQLVSDDGVTDAKKIVVNTYEAPRLMKTLEFVRKAYGEGDQVTAAIEIKRGTGEAFADKPITAVVTIDDAETARLAIKTDREGKAIARFAIPAKLTRGDGLLTILADDGGVTESIQKRIPIVMKTIAFAMFPEGGDLVDALPGRVYFMARTMIGKPADVEGKVVDDRGQTVAELASIHDGMGRFELVPSPDRRYRVQITKPAGIAQTFEVPAAKPGGCVLRSVSPGYASLRSASGASQPLPPPPASLRSAEPQRSADSLRVAAICNTKRTLLVEAVLREKRLASGGFEVEAGKPALVELPVDATAQGAVRVTLFSSRNEPLAERLVYHGRGADLKIALTADGKSYSPRDPVKLHVHTTDANGKPVKASVGIAVVDDNVVSFADDKSARILAHMFLEPELGASAADPIEEPNYYFSDKPDAVLAMDALLATRGYRRFDWRPVLGGQP